MKTNLFVFLLALLLPASTLLAQTGKIAGVVRDAGTGETLPGVNVMIVGTTQGATTDLEGYYAILNVKPGTYDVKATYVGYATTTAQNVRVNIDLTAVADFDLRGETVGLEEVVVAAARPVVQRDISASMSNMNAERMENLPATSITDVVGLQAGIQGLTVRGSGSDEVSFVVDGMSYTNPRDNTPFTGISYTSVEEIQVQTGGFNAEYGNVRSGMVNVVTKEGRNDRYSADVMLRYTPVQQKWDGIQWNDTEAYWWRPFFSELPEDGNITMIGTANAASPWDPYMQRQYPKFDGWNKVSQQLLADTDPLNDLTPAQAREVSLFRHRKDLEMTSPDYEFDGSIGGPVPVIGKMLGGLRFFGSYRQTQNAFSIPMMRETYMDRTGSFKVTSNLTSHIKLNLHAMLAEQNGLANSVNGGPGMLTGGNSIASTTLNLYNGWPVWSNDYWNPMDINRALVGFDLTHTLSATTFYQLSAQRMATKYHTFASPMRDTSIIHTVGNTKLDEAPFGYLAASIYDLSNLRLSGDWNQARDSSKVERWTANFDLTSQLNRYLMVKTGADFDYNIYNTRHQQYDPVYPDRNQQYEWDQSPLQAAAYAQAKLEFKGMVANVGLRLDYIKPTSTGWYTYEDFERVFAPYMGYEFLDSLVTTEVPGQLALSPRLGIAFPVTESSKLFFNYGHFRQMLSPQNMFVIRQNYAGGINYVGNPAHPMPKTVQYELGYEQNLFNMFLLRLSGYYKSLGDQTRNVNFISSDQLVNYWIGLPTEYEDIRGFEVTLEKNAGKWIRGFVNYTYMSTKNGFFGYDRYSENMVNQRQYERDYMGHYQNKPVARPFGRVNLEFLTPNDFGPDVLGANPLGDWRLTVIGHWQAGSAATWAGASSITIPGLRNNLRWADTKEIDLRFAKNIRTSAGNAQIFIDVNNVLNLKSCCGSGFEGSNDYDYYVQSLHLPGDIFKDVEGDAPYKWIKGDDKLGTYRSYDVEFVPIEIIENLEQVKTPYARPLYYIEGEDKYMWYRDGAFSEADPGYVDQVKKDKAYIDMPNQRSLVYLNPRRIQLGIRLSF